MHFMSTDRGMKRVGEQHAANGGNGLSVTRGRETRDCIPSLYSRVFMKSVYGCV